MRHNHAQDELSFSRVEKTVKTLLTESVGFSAQAKGRIWHNAQARADQFRPTLALRFSRAALYPAFVLLLTLGLMGGYAGVVFADGVSIPGEPLYVIEQGVESMWLSLTPDSRRYEVQLVLLERRVYELRALIDAGKPVPEGLFLELELLFSSMVDYVDYDISVQQVLPYVIEYRDSLALLNSRYTGVWGLSRVLDVADTAVIELGGDSLEQFPYMLKQRHGVG